MRLSLAALRELGSRPKRVNQREREAILKGAAEYFAEVRAKGDPLPTNFPPVTMTLEEALAPMTPALALRLRREKKEWRSRQR